MVLKTWTHDREKNKTKCLHDTVYSRGAPERPKAWGRYSWYLKLILYVKISLIP